MRIAIPEQVLAQARGRMIAYPHENAVTLYVREDDFGLARYPRELPVDVRLLHWEIDGALVVVLALRLDRNDHLTFEHWINAAEPAGVRMLQCLTGQREIDVLLVGQKDVRPHRVANKLAGVSERLVTAIRSRNAWTPAAFEAAQARVSQLYPSPHALWWSASPPANAGGPGRR